MRPSRYDHNDCINLLNFSLALLSFSLYIQNFVIYATRSLPPIATNVLYTNITLYLVCSGSMVGFIVSYKYWPLTINYPLSVNLSQNVLFFTTSKVQLISSNVGTLFPTVNPQTKHRAFCK